MDSSEGWTWDLAFHVQAHSLWEKCGFKGTEICFFRSVRWANVQALGEAVVAGSLIPYSSEEARLGTAMRI